MAEDSSGKKKSSESKPAAPTEKKSLPILPILNEQIESDEQDLEEIFNEDRVEHRHGQSEPEKD